MRGRHVPRHPYSAARVSWEGGRARLRPPATGRLPEGWVRGRWSVLSPGTERRHLAASRGGTPRDAGYMTLGRTDDRSGWTVAPVPHGACFALDCPGAVVAPPGVPVATAAVARFQQIALLGFARLPPGVDLDAAVVVGSGPVALGAALELARRGATSIRVATARPDPPIATVPGAVPILKAEGGRARLVVDAVGAPERAARLLAPGGTLGLLGTPPAAAGLPALATHRDGRTVVGMHELAPAEPGAYQAAYTAACDWLTAHIAPDRLASWCRTVPGRLADRTLGHLDPRPAEPVLLFDWEGET